MPKTTFQQAGGTGISKGIALSGKAPQFKDIYMRQVQQQQAADERRAAAERKAVASIGKDIKIDGIHNLLVGDVTRDVASTISKLQENYGSMNFNERNAELRSLYARVQVAKNQSKDYEGTETILAKIASDGGVGAEEASRGLNAMRSGRWENVIDAEDDDFGIFRFDPQSRTILANGIPTTDIEGKVRADLSNKDLYTDPAGDIRLQEFKDTEGNVTRKYTERYKIPKTQIEGFAEIRLSDPAFKDNFEYRQYKAGKLPADYMQLKKSDNPNDVAIAHDMLRDNLVDYMDSRQGERRETTKTKASKGKGDLTWNYSTGNLGDKIQAGYRESTGGRVVGLIKDPKTGESVKPTEISIPETTRLIDMSFKGKNPNPSSTTLKRGDDVEKGVIKGLVVNPDGSKEIVAAVYYPKTKDEAASWVYELFPYDKSNENTFKAIWDGFDVDEFVKAQEPEQVVEESIEVKEGVQRVAVPQEGDVRSGYEFLGGDPRDKNNWKKVE